LVAMAMAWGPPSFHVPVPTFVHRRRRDGARFHRERVVYTIGTNVNES
jgi:hypothetical protein